MSAPLQRPTQILFTCDGVAVDRAWLDVPVPRSGETVYLTRDNPADIDFVGTVTNVVWRFGGVGVVAEVMLKKIKNSKEDS